MKERGFEIVKGYEDQGINLPLRKTSFAAGYDIEAQRVGAVGIDDGDGVDAVAEALAHLAALRVADEAVEQHGVERYLVHMLHAGEYHARDPEEQYVISCDEHVGRIEILELGRLVGPAES